MAVFCAHIFCAPFCRRGCEDLFQVVFTVVSLKPRQNPKILAAHPYIFSVNSLPPDGTSQLGSYTQCKVSKNKAKPEAAFAGNNLLPTEGGAACHRRFVSKKQHWQPTTGELIARVFWCHFGMRNRSKYPDEMMLKVKLV